MAVIWKGRKPLLTEDQYQSVQERLALWEANSPQRIAREYCVAVNVILDIAAGHGPKRYGGNGSR
jgi:hypothetical protein